MNAMFVGKQYVGLKLVHAYEMSRADAEKHLGHPLKTTGSDTPDNGYLVTYEGCYQSWCPKDIFEAANRQIDGLTFGMALEYLKRGKKVTRAGWNGKGMFLWLKPGTTIKAEWCKDEELKNIVEANGGEIEALGTICMKTADNKVLSGWLASQTDMLAEDWSIIG